MPYASLRDFTDTLEKTGRLVRVAHPGFQTAERRVDLREPRRQFLLQPEVELRGVVLDMRTGAPIAGAWIGSFAESEAGEKPLERPTWATRGVLPGRSDAGGRFVLPGHTAGRWQVVAKHPDYLLERSAPQVVENGAELPPIELRLDPGILQPGDDAFHRGRLTSGQLDAERAAVRVGS